MGIGLSGMVSGLETDQLIKQLMSAERTKVTKVKNKITTNEWETEKWKDLNKKIYALYTGSLAKMKTQGNYLTKKTTSSNDKVVSVKAGSTAPIGTHYVTVNSVASAQYVTSGTFTSAAKLTADSKLLDAGVAAGTKISLACGSKSAELVVDGETTFTDLIDSCKKAGLNVNFDETRQCLYISSRQSGTENQFTITTGMQNSTSAGALNSLRDAAGFSAMSASDKTEFTNALDTLEKSESTEINEILTKADHGETLTDAEKKIKDAYDTVQNAILENTAKDKAQASVEEELKAQFMTSLRDGTAVTVYGKEYTAEEAAAAKEEIIKIATDEYEEEVFADIYGDVEALNNTSYSTIKGILAKTEEERSEDEKALLTAFEGVAETPEGETPQPSLREQFTTALGTLTEGAGYDTEAYQQVYERAITATAEVEAEEVVKLSEAAAEIESRKNTILGDPADAEMIAAKAAFASDITTYANTAAFDPSANGLAAIGLVDVDGSAMASGGNAVGMSVYAATDANISVNGADIVSGSNNINVNGLTLDLISAAPGETISVSVSQDTDSVYNMVKQFVKDYNALVEEMNNAYYAESARGYDPLTDEQKDSMGDTEVEKWEKKIKDSLLRRDNTLGSLISAMRSTLNESVKVDGKDYSLSTFGICTTKYSEKGKLHIYGDQEDSESMTYDDKLKKAIEEDPEKVMEVLQGISKKLYDTMADKMKASEISSALTFYNDKQMTKELTSYKKELTRQEDRLTEIEDRYYKQFSSMETALSKLSTQSSSLLSMLGTGSSR